MIPRFGSFHQQARRNRRQHIIYFGGGTLTFAIITGLLLFYSQNPVDAHESANVQEPMADVAFNNVLVIAPTTVVPQGSKLSSVELREVYWPRNEVPEGAIRDIEVARGMYAKVGLAANQPVIRSNLSPTPPVGGVAELIPAGHRAVTIEVDATSGVEGWATPGAHVDVLLTYYDEEDKLNKTRAAVEDAVVLSYNGRTKKVNELEVGPSSATSTVTLAVAASDSLKIQTARAMGRISLVLRNSQDPLSIGKGTFASNEWDRKQQEAKSERYVSKAFASVRGQDGSKKEFMLGPDARWWSTNNSKEGY